MIYCIHDEHANHNMTDVDNYRYMIILISHILVRKDIDANEHDRLSNITPRHKLK